MRATRLVPAQSVVTGCGKRVPIVRLLAVAMNPSGGSSRRGMSEAGTYPSQVPSRPVWMAAVVAQTAPPATKSIPRPIPIRESRRMDLG